MLDRVMAPAWKSLRSACRLGAGRPRSARFAALAWAAAWISILAACGHAPPAVLPAAPAMPEASTGTNAKPGWLHERMAVSAAHPLAADAGLAMLRAGGYAIDAAVAVQMVLALVEPQSSGIGGGAFLLHFDGTRVQAWDGRETAPAAADEALFLEPDGRPLPMAQAIVGGRSVGVPGAVRMLEAAHRAHGRLPWARLFEPAIELAEQGFEMSPRLHGLLQRETALQRDPQAGPYFFKPDGTPRAVGERLRNPALAQVLRALATHGSAALHEGPVAADIVARVRRHPQAGQMSLGDLAGYQPRLRDALCADWAARWRVCGMPPPSSGQLVLMQMLGVLGQLQPAPPALADPPAVDWLHLFSEAARLAFADRAQYVADPDFVDPPGGDWSKLLDAAYLRSRAALIGPRSMGVAQPGQPDRMARAYAPQPDQPEHGTSHVSIVDAEGHAVALTTSIEAAFGARLMSDGGTGLAGGFLLNNQLTDFSLTPRDAQGRPVANRVQPGKRPRSTMTPTLVFERASGRLALVVGSPGGPLIPLSVARTLIAALEGGTPLQAALDLPNFGSLNGPTLLEKGRFDAATVAALRARGHTVLEVELTSGVQALQRVPGGWAGAADPRREGVVRGR